MPQNSSPDGKTETVDAALDRLLQAIGEEPVPERIARLARELQNALNRPTRSAARKSGG